MPNTEKRTADLLPGSWLGEPGMAYLHEVDAELFVARGSFGDAFCALDRASALRSGAWGADSQLGALSSLLIVAMQSKWKADRTNSSEDRDIAAALIDRAIARADAAIAMADETILADSGQMRPGFEHAGAGLAHTLFWRGRAGLEREDLREKTEPPADDREKARAALGQAAERARAASLPDQECDEIAAWNAVAERKPWRALHDLIARAPKGADPLRRGVVTALLSVAGVAEVPHRLVLRLPDDFFPDVETLIQLILGGPHGKDNVDIPAFQRAVKERVGIEPPSVLILRISGEMRDQVDVLLDRELIDGETIDNENYDWFGAERKMSKAQAAVAILARAVMRNLDRIVSADVARDAKVSDFPNDAWAPVLRLLLADRTPLNDHERLRRAVAAVAWGRADPVVAAQNYQLEIDLPVASEEPTVTKVLPEQLAPLQDAVERSGGGRAVELAYDAARNLEKWVEENTFRQTPPRVLEAPDPKLRPYLAALLRARFPDLAVWTSKTARDWLRRTKQGSSLDGRSSAPSDAINVEPRDPTPPGSPSL